MSEKNIMSKGQLFTVHHYYIIIYTFDSLCNLQDYKKVPGGFLNMTCWLVGRLFLYSSISTCMGYLILKFKYFAYNFFFFWR